MAVRESLRAVLAEPAEPGAPGPIARDWLLVAVAVAAVATEGALRPELTWRPFAVAAAAAVALALPWRRTHPLAMLLLVFGSAIPLDLLLSLDEGTTGLGTMIFVLLFPYALVRWGSGRAIVGGLAFLIVPVSLGIAMSWTGTGDAIGATAVVLAPIAFGAAVRKTSNDRTRRLAQMKLLERERLARELHDTVAHHVSAIVIQAQAGRTVATTRPDVAVTALENIEAAATEALAEMRAMVRILRDADRDDEADTLAPLGGIADLERLSARSGDLRVEVDRSGPLDDVPPAVDAAVYRLVQESITNVVRHARHATLVTVTVRADADAVRLQVRDDGDTSHADAAPVPGYGIVGMAERARLLGGTCTAAPDPAGGWVVTATLPCTPTNGADRTNRVTDSTCAISNPGGAPAVGRPSRGHPMTIRVLIADDQELVRTGLAMILGAQPGIEVVGEAVDGREAIELAHRLRPDVCLFDIRMPGVDGIEATRQLAGPGVDEPFAVVVITTFDLDEYVHGALKAGAKGFLLKDAGPDLLVQAIHAAAEGDALIAPSITARLLATFASSGPGPTPAQPVEPLTDREEEVLLTVARGRTNAEIATDLHISLSTVKTHLASLMAKLGARNRVEIVIWAYETGRIRA